MSEEENHDEIGADRGAVPLDAITYARLHALLQSLSKERDVTESSLLREVLVAALEKVEKEDPEQFAEELRAKR